jgi:hypothetical protein
VINERKIVKRIGKKEVGSNEQDTPNFLQKTNGRGYLLISENIEDKSERR